jgi:hypothetical protein
MLAASTKQMSVDFRDARRPMASAPLYLPIILCLAGAMRKGKTSFSAPTE